MNKITLYSLALSLALLATSCSKETGETKVESPPKVAFQELYDQGIDRYLGVFSPDTAKLVSPGTYEHKFSGMDAPICFTGNQFSMFTRDGSSNSLLIFLQGGGFCAPVNCTAVETGIPLVPFGILSPNDPQGPVSDYDLGYVPYCDGTAFMGDRELDSNGDGVVDRFFRGVQNLSASLDVIASTYPNPDKIVLAGNSAGGYAVHAALPLVRKLYPAVKIYVINDSGLGILDPGGMNILLNYWNAGAFFPATCSDCIGADGNLTGYHLYQLNQDDNVMMAYISSKQDSVIAAGLSTGGPGLESQIIEAVNEMNATYPNRFQGLIANGEFHTSLIRDFRRAIGGTTVNQWLNAMINDSTAWDTKIE